MLYNLYISSKSGNHNLFGISRNQLEKIVDAYLWGKKDITIRGTRHVLEETKSLRIFEHNTEPSPEDSSAYYLGNVNFRKKESAHYYLPPETLLKMGKEVTEYFLRDQEYGELNDNEKFNGKPQNPSNNMQKKSQEQILREQLIKSSYDVANSASPNPQTMQPALKTRLFGVSAELFWTISISLISAAFGLGHYFGSNRFDKNLIELNDVNRDLKDSIKVRDNTINYIRHNSDSALNILGHMPYNEMTLDSQSYRKVQTTIENAGAALYLNK